MSDVFFLSFFRAVVEGDSTSLHDGVGNGAMQRLRPPGLDLSSAVAHKAITPEDDLLTAQAR